jgi:hypothetical protein
MSNRPIYSPLAHMLFQNRQTLQPTDANEINRACKVPLPVQASSALGPRSRFRNAPRQNMLTYSLNLMTPEYFSSKVIFQ